MGHGPIVPIGRVIKGKNSSILYRKSINVSQGLSGRLTVKTQINLETQKNRNRNLEK